MNRYPVASDPPRGEGVLVAREGEDAAPVPGAEPIAVEHVAPLPSINRLIRGLPPVGSASPKTS